MNLNKRMKIKDFFLSGEEFSLEQTEIPGIWKTSPLPQDVSKYYESKDYISHHQDSSNLKEKIYKFLQKFNLNYKYNILSKNLFQGAKVLDYGCGVGEFLKFIEEDFTTFGFELNDAAKNIAKLKTSKTVFISSLLELENETLDAITLWHVLEHIENQKEILDLFYNKLKNNGLLIIAVPNPASYDALHYREFWAAYDVPRHIYHFSKSGMQNLMNNKNWKIEKIKPLLLDSFYISLLSEKYKKSRLFWLKGFFFGAISNFKALKTGEFSSLIYIIKKK